MTLSGRIAAALGSPTGLVVTVSLSGLSYVVGWLLPSPAYVNAVTLFLSHLAIWITVLLLMAGNQDTAAIKHMLAEQVRANPNIPDEVAECE